MYLFPLVALIAASVLRSTAAAMPDCRELRSTDEAVRVLEENRHRAVPVSDSCLCSVMARGSADEAVAVGSAFTRYFRVRDTLLFCAWRNRTLRENRKLFTLLLRGWKKNRPYLNAVLAAYQKAGATRRMDTLLTILDHERELEVHQLLEWIEAKQVLDDYDSVPGLFCRIIRGRPQLQPLALNRFELLLDELSPVLADSLLHRFGRAVSAAPVADSAAVRRWIIDQYGRKLLFGRQIAAVLHSGKNTAEQCSLLHAIARSCIDDRLFRPAIAAGTALYGLDCAAGMRQETAALLHGAYRALGKRDSAAFWLERSGVTTEKNRLEAVELHLSLGNLPKAAELLKMLPPSIGRDTLYLRYLLLSDSLAPALHRAFDDNTPLARAPFPRMIWRVRTSLFCGMADTCIRLLDSVAAHPAFATAVPLFQDYHYWLLRLASSPQELAKFRQIEYTLFKDDRKKASRLLCESQRDSTNDWRIAVRIAEEQLAHSEAADAVSTLRCTPAGRQSEYLYCLADALLHDQSYREARELLQRLLLEFPVDQYTTRARLLLARIP